MSITPIGIATFVVGFLCLLLGKRALAAALVIASLLGAAAAMFIGDLNIMPAQVVLVFVGLSLALHPRQLPEVLVALTPPRPAFWFFCLVAYGIVSSLIYPRLFAGVTDVFPIAQTSSDGFYTSVPLGPVSGNLSQPLYMIGNLACLLFFLSVANSRDGFRFLTASLLAHGVLNIAFAVIDVATFATGTQSVLDFMRNANYAMLHEGMLFGMKRIVGSFTETSAFARVSIGVIGFAATLWICRRHTAVAGTVALVTLVMVVLSTSSSGLAILPLLLFLLFATATKLAVIDRRPQPGLIVLLVGAPLVMVVAGILLALNREMAEVVQSYVDTLVVNKMSTDSGIERSSWNSSAWQNFLDTWGLGVGLGTNRTSSFAMALLSHVGLIGVFLYLAFIFTAIIRIPERPGSYVADVKLAARNACLGLIATDTLVSSTIDQGYFFIALIALAASRPDPLLVSRERRPQFAPEQRYGPAT